MTDGSDIKQDQAPAQANILRDMATRHRAVKAQEHAALLAALRVAFGRMARQCRGLDGMVKDITAVDASLPEVLDLAEPGMFLALLDGEGDRIGVFMAGAEVLTGMIEALATGQVDAQPTVPRKPTRTDAALMAPMIDSFLCLAEERCGSLPQASQLAGYAYGSFLDDPRPLGLMLDEGMYSVLKFHVSLGLGAKIGDWILVLPAPAPEAQTGDADAVAQQAEVAWKASLQEVVSDCPVVLEPILCRVQIPLAEALRLRPGSMLRVPEAALEALSVETISHQPVGTGRLGQARGQRALRLTADPGILRDTLGIQPALQALAASIMPVTPKQTGPDQGRQIDVPMETGPSIATGSGGDSATGLASDQP